MSLLEQNTTKKGREFLVPEFGPGNNKKYEVKAIWDSAVYARESKSGHLLSLYYLMSWKGYPKEENTWEPASAIQHLRKFISLFNKDRPSKSTTTSPTIDIASPMARPTAKSNEPPKRKHRWPTGRAKKRAKKC